MVYSVLLGIETVQLQNVLKKLVKFKEKAPSTLLVETVPLESELKLPTSCFSLAGPDHRGELGGDHTHRGPEDSDGEREEVQ